MRLATCLVEGITRLAVADGDTVTLPDLKPQVADEGAMLDLIDHADRVLPTLKECIRHDRGSRRVPQSQVRILAPIPRPRKNIICLGWNYAEHAAESARASGRELELPEVPVVFTKAVTTVCGPSDAVTLDPRITTELDWEVELGVIIGRGGRGIPRESALEHVFGYTVINDLSARDLQRRHKQFFMGKSLDGTCPMGPVIVTADEIPNPQNLTLRCRVNGKLKQESSTRHQIFDVASTIAILSRGMTLEAGDIISTGTPSGVGFGRNPPEFLHAGDLVECEVEGIGTLANPIVSPSSITAP